MIRHAIFADVVELAEVMHDMWARSKYFGVVSFDVKDGKSLLIECLQRQDSKQPGGKCVYVSETDGEIDGFIIGALDATYHGLDGLTAADLFFYVAPDGDPTAAQNLMRHFFDWAVACDPDVEIVMGATDAIHDYRKTEKLYRHMGMTQVGVIYEKRVAT